MRGGEGRSTREELELELIGPFRVLCARRQDGGSTVVIRSATSSLRSDGMKHTDFGNIPLMSPHTPVVGAPAPRTHISFPRLSIEAGRAGLDAAPHLLEPRRSRVARGAVRIARVVGYVTTGTLARSGLRVFRADALAEKALNGLERCSGWRRGYQEMIAAERARLRIQQLLRTRQARYERFLGLRERIRLTGKPFSESGSSLHLNPACHWMRFRGDAGARQDHDVPSSVLFFLIDERILGIRMSLEEQVLLNELADYQPCTVRQWTRISSLADARQLGAMALQLHDIGLAAWDET